MKKIIFAPIEVDIKLEDNGSKYYVADAKFPSVDELSNYCRHELLVQAVKACFGNEAEVYGGSFDDVENETQGIVWIHNPDMNVLFDVQHGQYIFYPAGSGGNSWTPS